MMKAINKKLILVLLFSLVIISCNVSNRLSSNYCFKGSRSNFTSGYAYTGATISFTDSEFKMKDYFFESKKLRDQNKYYKKEVWIGEFKVNGDTIVCTVKDTSEYSGSKYLFLVQGSKRISMLDRNKAILQKWHRCSIKEASLQQ